MHQNDHAVNTHQPKSSDRPDAPTGSRAASPAEAPMNEPYELAMVLSHYDLGVIKGIAPIGRGSSGTPKLLIQSSAGRFMLKRRGFAHGDEDTVKFGHRLQHALHASNFPLPVLIGARDTGKSSVRVRTRSYELFRYIEAERYRGSIEQTQQAGYTLSAFHAIVRSLDPIGLQRAQTYHNNPTVADRLLLIADRATSLASVCQKLAERYEHAASESEQAGLQSWPEHVIHGDWHAGNLLYDGERLIGVVDYDTARAGQRVLDIASGALQFSLISDAPIPGSWPAHLDESRYKAFISGYESLEAERPGALVSTAEIAILPSLMVESLVSEAIGPIATTGKFGAHDPAPVLEMIERKVRWILENATRLQSLLG